MLDLRLTACARFVRPGCKVCDVGTDHAYLPCYLIKNQITQQVIAADENEKPLSCARVHIREQGLSEQIRTVLSDGLSAIRAEEADDIVIAGMGGELIARILLSCEWGKNPQKHFILQPMTQADFLRRTLCCHGFSILKEEPVVENGHFYSVFLCQWTGERQELDEVSALIGNVPQSSSPHRDAYLLFQSNRMERIADGLSRSQEQKGLADHYRSLAEKIRSFLPNSKKNDIL